MSLRRSPVPAPHEGYNAFDDEFRTATTSQSPLVSSPSSSHQMSPVVFEELKQLPGNTRCVDCGSMAPDWGSPKLGIFMCFQCSGRHRGLGVHLSFVRSVQMDAWNDQQIALMRVGGNDQCNAFLRRHGIAETTLDATTQGEQRGRIIHDKYDSDAALLYQQVLKAKVDGTPIPTQLSTPRTTGAAVPLLRKMEGFGSAPPHTAAPSWSTSSNMAGAAAVVCLAMVGVAVWMVAPH
jgi:Putative GTPase activating protein for Arf